MDRWIAVDWGTSSFRAYLIEDDVVFDTIKTEDGMKFVKDNNFENTSINLNHCLVVADKNVPKKLIKEVLKSLPRYSTIIHYFMSISANHNIVVISFGIFSSW